MSPRLLIVVGAVLLLLTAVVHALGAPMVSDWVLPAHREPMLLVWLLLSADWALTGLLWLWCARRGDAAMRPVVYISALIPIIAAVGLAIVAGPAFFGIWMLVAAAVPALWGARRL